LPSAHARWHGTATMPPFHTTGIKGVHEDTHGNGER
jgi:hypothetical protein